MLIYSNNGLKWYILILKIKSQTLSYPLWGMKNNTREFTEFFDLKN